MQIDIDGKEPRINKLSGVLTGDNSLDTSFVDFEPGDGTRYRIQFTIIDERDFHIAILMESKGSAGTVGMREMNFQKEILEDSTSLTDWYESGPVQYLRSKLGNLNPWTLRAVIHAWAIVCEEEKGEFV